MSQLQNRASSLLERWALAAESHWHSDAGDPGLGCYGPGYLHWGIQSNWNYMAAVATLAGQAHTRDAARWQSRALAALRFALATHATGTRPGNDGKPWGNSWISMLGIERGMHGLGGIQDALTAADQLALRRLLISEAEWLRLQPSRGKVSGIAAGKWGHEGRNFPESNLWSGCLLWRVAAMYPEEAQAADWRLQAHRFLMNSVSVDADSQDATEIAGRPVSAWHVGANFFPGYALDHHGYLNVGYMAICTSNAAMLHFDLKRAGLQPPDSLYHHQADLWQVLRRMIFGDGRLARLGGDSRVRYAYCQEYLLPALLFAADQLQDPHALDLVDRQLSLIEQEAAGGDGMFYGQRLDHLRHNNPHYYTRLESDRACVLAMLLNYLPHVRVPPPPAAPFELSVAGTWLDEAHGAVMHRSPRRLAAFSWRAYAQTEAMCLPPGAGNLAEWSSNLCPRVRFLGDDGSHPGYHRRLITQQVRAFEGGFVTAGTVMEGVNVSLDEGAQCTDQAVTHLAFAALPDDRTCLCLQHVVTATDRIVYLAELQDLRLVIPNDLLNGSRRTLRTDATQTVLESPPARSEMLELGSRWANVDDQLGLVVLHGGERLHVERSTVRRGGRYQSIFTEALCLHHRQDVRRCLPGEILVDAGFAVLAGATAEETSALKGGAITTTNPALRGIWAEGANGHRYALLANFGTESLAVCLFGDAITLHAGTATVHGPLPGIPGPL